MATSQLLKQDVFGYLRPEQINSIHNVSEIIERHAGDIVYTRGEKARYLYVVLDGQVETLLSAKEGEAAVRIESLSRDAIFGASASFEPGTYTLTARCTADSKILKIDAAALRRLLEEDCRMGYAIQRHISDLYFKRFVEMTDRFEAVVTDMSLQRE